MRKIIKGVKTRQGMAALWETGGNDGKKGKVRLIAKPDGSRPVALFLNFDESTNLNGEQALAAVHKNFFVIEGELADNLIITIYRIVEISVGQDIKITLAKFNRSFNSQWENRLIKNLEEAVDAVNDKLFCQGCREPYYVCWPRRRH